MNADKYFFLIMSLIVSGIITETSILIIDSYAQEQGKVSTLTSTLVNLELRDIEVGESPTGLIYVKGTAINNSTFDTRDVNVLVNLFDVNNSTVSETSRFITPASSTFKPGYERDFYFFVSANNVDHYVITAQGEKVS